MRVPAPFPLPPILIRLPEVRRHIEEEDEEKEKPHDVEFISRLRGEGYQDDLIKMGLKVARNHMRPLEEAYRIGSNYVREMAK